MKPIALIVACLALIALPARAHALPVVTAGSATVQAGDTFTIPISIADAVELSSWQFDLAFDPALLSASAITEGPFLSQSGASLTLFIPGVIDNTTGHITLVSDAFVDLPPGPSGSGVLADITFQALAVGVSPLTLSNVFLDFTDAAAVSGQVTILSQTSVPAPDALMLMTVGLGVWVGRGWRRRANARLVTISAALFAILAPTADPLGAARGGGCRRSRS